MAQLAAGRAAVAQPGDLHHHRGQGRVGRRDGDGVCPAQGGSPQGDALGVEVLLVAGEADGGAPVGLLALEVDELPGLAAAGPEAAVVEHQHGHAGPGEPLGVPEQPVHGPAEAVGHDHAGQGPGGLGCGPVEVADQGDAVRLEGDLLAIHPLVHEPSKAGWDGHVPCSAFLWPAR